MVNGEEEPGFSPLHHSPFTIHDSLYTLGTRALMPQVIS